MKSVSSARGGPVRHACSLAVLFTASAALANEPIRPRAELLKEGYRPAPLARAQITAVPQEPPSHSLPWPVRFENARHTIGNAMAQFQDYTGEPYFHGGCDLRVARNGAVTAPVAGRLEAGHYSYATNADGSMTKYFKPWPASGPDAYFEVAITTDNGIRYELHHVDRDSLPRDIVALLDEGARGAKPHIEAGRALGTAIEWQNSDTDSTLYHHIHYNVIRADGVRINPEWISAPLEDQRKPLIANVYAIASGTNTARKLSFGETLSTRPTELIVEASDELGTNIYKQTPPRVQFVPDTGNAGGAVGWDFTHTLAAPSGRTPDIRNVFAIHQASTAGRLTTVGNYNARRFYFRIALPSTVANGRVVVGDGAGNVTEWPLRW